MGLPTIGQKGESLRKTLTWNRMSFGGQLFFQKFGEAGRASICDSFEQATCRMAKHIGFSIPRARIYETVVHSQSPLATVSSKRRVECENTMVLALRELAYAKLSGTVKVHWRQFRANDVSNCKTQWFLHSESSHLRNCHELAKSTCESVEQTTCQKSKHTGFRTPAASG